MYSNKKINLVHSVVERTYIKERRWVAVFVTGQQVPESGIYRVIHAGHRLAHEVTLLRGERFPRCSKCYDEVVFEAVQLVPHLEERMRIVLNELPEMNGGRHESVA